MPSSKSVAIVGQGYVGLPLAYALTKVGYEVLGVDTHVTRVNQISRGESPIEDISNSQITEMLSSKRYRVTTSYEQLSEVEISVICVPTPVDAENNPDLSALKSASTAIARFAKPGSLIINESTSFPGTVRLVIGEIFAKERPGEEFDFACAPERVDPGNKHWGHSNTPRLVGALTSKAMSRAYDFYSEICEEVVKVSSPEVAEFAKLLENSFRQVNIALITEISKLTRISDVNIHEVIEAASTKPYGFMKFVPSIGVGGHCIPVDPLYLSWYAKQKGQSIEIVELAQKINDNQPKNVVNRVEEILENKVGRILVVGMGYKSQTSDLRESPSVEVYEILKDRGHNVKWRDSLIKEFDGTTSFNSISGIDLVVYAQVNSAFDLNEVGISKIKVLDCTGSLPDLPNVFQI